MDGMLDLMSLFGSKKGKTEKKTTRTKRQQRRLLKAEERRKNKKVLKAQKSSKKGGNAPQTGNERVATARAHKMGLTLDQYRSKFPKGGVS